MPRRLSCLETRYLDACKRHEVLPNLAVLSWFYEANTQKSADQKCTMVVLLDHLSDADFSPLIDVFLAINFSDIDAVDVVYESHSLLNSTCIMPLLHAIGLKLRVVDLQDMPSVDDFFRDLCQGGLACQVLNLRSSGIQKLNMSGSFKQLHTLNLDFCTSLASLQKDCFACMPNLISLSMCETRVSNMWTTSAALTKLSSLVELRFQNCLCCKGTGPCPVSSYAMTNLLVHDRIESGALSSSCLAALNAKFNSQIEVSFGKMSVHGNYEYPPNELNYDSTDASIALKKYASHHPSPICFEKNYRNYMLASLPGLVVLDNMLIRKEERQMAKKIFSEYYERIPYNRQQRESVVNVLHMREMGVGSAHWQNSSQKMQPFTRRKSQYFYSRSLCAAKLGSSAWPLLCPVSASSITKEESKSLQPRQFEYHPSNSSLMVFGTLDGEILVINHENGHTIGYAPPIGSESSVLGLCWLKKYPSKLLAGSDNGSLRLYDINNMLPMDVEDYSSLSTDKYDDFEQLTSIHINSTDDQFLASGYSKHVALYDIQSERCLQLFTNMHRGPINVAKFAHRSPSLFVTSSFDHDVKMWDLRQKPLWPCYTASSSRGNVTVCFSPDDLYLLVSAVDNEVKQLLAVDGRVHMNFKITSTGSSHNYTRSYYMNGRDYVISGSSDESVVRVCCAQTGRRLRDVDLEGGGPGSSKFVQSLRGDPFRHFQMAILASSRHPSAKLEIIKVNMLASNHCAKEFYHAQPFNPCSCPGA